MDKSYLGIEIENGQVRIVPVINNLACGSMIANAGNAAVTEEISRTIREKLHEKKLRERSAAISLPDSEIIDREFIAAPAAEEEFLLSLPDRFSDYISGEKKQDYYYDYSITAAFYDGEGRIDSYEVHAVAVRKAVIRYYQNILKKAGLKLKTAVPRRIALENLLRNLTSEISPECGILDIGSQSTVIYHFRDHKLSFVREIDFMMKTAEGPSAYEELSAEIMKGAEFIYNSGKPDDIRKIYMTGAGASNKGCVAAIAEKLAGVSCCSFKDFFGGNFSAGEAALCSAAAGAAMVISDGKPDNGNNDLSVKTGINLAKKQKKNTFKPKYVLLMALAAAVLFFFIKIGIADILKQAENLDKELAVLEDNLEKLEEENTDYQEIFEEYIRKGYGYRTADEALLRDREEMLSAVEEILFGCGEVVSIVCDDNSLDVSIAGTSMETVADAVSMLLQTEGIQFCRVYNATDSTAAARSSTDQKGTQSSDISEIKIRVVFEDAAGGDDNED